MKTRESEIFNNYIKLAMDAGLISEDEIKKTAEADNKTRYDSKTWSDIEILYGHKFEPNKDKDQSLVDVAHPETMVVGPAYDAMNAVVENGHQRQQIMTYVALKDPDGQLVQRRYVKALHDLQNTLVSTGFAMDSVDETEIMKLADSCAGRLHKEAGLFLALGLGAAALMGVTWYFTQAEVDIQNIKANANNLMKELRDVQTESYSGQIINKVEEIQTLADTYINKVQKLAEYGNEIKIAGQNGDVQKVNQIYGLGNVILDQVKVLSSQLLTHAKDIDQMKSDVSNLGGQSSENSNWYNKLLGIKDFMFGSEANDVLRNIDGLVGAIAKSMKRADYVMEEFKRKYGAAIGKKLEIDARSQEQQAHETPTIQTQKDQIEIPDNYFGARQVVTL